MRNTFSDPVGPIHRADELIDKYGRVKSYRRKVFSNKYLLVKNEQWKHLTNK